MPALKTITPIIPGKYYHIFNRGTNKNAIFFSEENYLYFMKLYDIYLSSYISLLAYSLMRNHFHFLIQAKEKIDMSSFTTNDIHDTEESISKTISNQFRKFFISYTMAINVQENRQGGLFERTFKRIEITSEEYLKYLAFYIHYNPQKHGLAADFRDYKYSSWEAYNSLKPTKIDKKLLLELFDGRNELLEYHNYFHEENGLIELE